MNHLLSPGSFDSELLPHLAPSFLLGMRSSLSDYNEAFNRSKTLSDMLDANIDGLSHISRLKLTRLYRSYRELVSRLDSNNSSHNKPDLLKQSLKEQVLSIDGFPPSYYYPNPRSPFEQYLSSMQKASRKRSLVDRLYFQMHESHMAGWYMVFETLTYDPNAPGASDALLFGQSWQDHVYAVRNSVCKRIYGTQRSPKGVKYTDFSHYCAVPELHKSGRVHLHVLWFVKELPACASYIDPNTYTTLPYRREVNGWPKTDFGFSTAIAVRYGDDAFTKKGWKWPVDKVTKRAIPCKEHYAVAVYVSKYLDKPRPEALCHKKTRLSQGLGLQTLRQRIQLMSPIALYQMLAPRTRLTLFGRSISPTLLKVTISRELSIRLRDALRQMSILSSKRRFLTSMGELVQPPALFRRPLISILPTLLSNQLNSTLFRTLSMKKTVISDEIDQFFPDTLPDPGFGHLGKTKPLSYVRL